MVAARHDPSPRPSHMRWRPSRHPKAPVLRRCLGGWSGVRQSVKVAVKGAFGLIASRAEMEEKSEIRIEARVRPDYLQMFECWTGKRALL
jgi:hypothetical protein